MDSQRIQGCLLFCNFVEATWSLHNLEIMINSKQNDVDEKSSVICFETIAMPEKHVKKVRVKHACQFHKSRHEKCSETCLHREHEQQKKISLPPKPIIIINRNGKRHREYIVNKIIDHKRMPNGTYQFLVNWKGYSSLYDTWEPYSSFVKPDKTITKQLQKYIDRAEL